MQYITVTICSNEPESIFISSLSQHNMPNTHATTFLKYVSASMYHYPKNITTPRTVNFAWDFHCWNTYSEAITCYNLNNISINATVKNFVRQLCHINAFNQNGWFHYFLFNRKKIWHHPLQESKWLLIKAQLNHDSKQNYLKK